MFRMLYVLALLIPVATSTATSPNAHEIIQKSVSATRQDWSEAPNYAFVDREIVGKHGHVQPAKTYEVLMIEGSPYNKLIAINDVPLSPQQRAIQARKLAAIINKRQHESESARQKRIAKYIRERGQDHRMLTEMVDAFDYTLVGEDMLAGHKVWVLKAAPKPGYVPHNHEEKMLQRMRGQMWIDEATCQWVKVQADVVKPVSMYGFMAKVKPGTRFELQQERVAPGLWLPKHFSVQVKATALGIWNENSREDDTYRAYQPMSQAIAKGAAPLDAITDTSR